MAECYHNYCDTSELNKTVPFANMNFLKKSIQTMIDVVVDLTESECAHSRRVVHRAGKKLDSNYIFLNKADFTIIENVDHLNSNSFYFYISID